MAIVEEKAKYTVSVPDFTNGEDLNTFVTQLEANTDKFGVKKLLTNISKYQKHITIAEKFAQQAQHTAGYINGTRTKKPANKALKTAQRFYESLNTAGLRAQCVVMAIDYDSFDDQEGIIDALVEKSASAMSNGVVG